MVANELKHTTDMTLVEPDELLGYMVLGQQAPMPGADAYSTDGETHRLWSDGQDGNLVTNTHGCWGFFPVVN